MGSETPCPRCEYRSVCRFEPSQGYRMLPKMDRPTVLANVAEEVRVDEAGK
jgi:ATP-dependent helicase/DNAse subunit B